MESKHTTEARKAETDAEELAPPSSQSDMRSRATLKFVHHLGMDSTLAGSLGGREPTNNFFDPDPGRIERELRAEAVGTVGGIALGAGLVGYPALVFGTENLSAAGLASAGRAITQQAGAALSRTGAALGTSAAGVLQIGSDFVHGFTLPGPPPATAAGAFGAAVRVAADRVIDRFSRRR